MSEAGAAEHLDVLIVGAGLSGIGAAHHVATSCPWATFAVVEARGAIGGTWDLFRYPGIRSDSDMFTLGYPFRPWDGDKSIADGDSIREYIRATAREDGTDEKIRFHTRVVAASWSSEDARWTVDLQRTDPASGAVEDQRLTCGWLFSCTGYYRYDRGHEPAFPGSDRFTGQVVHPQRWPDDLEVAGKEVVVIGSGATAVTLVPSLAAQGAHVTMLQRSPSYIATMPESNPLAPPLRKLLGERRAGRAIRWLNAVMTQGSYKLSRSRPELVKKLLKAQVKLQLPKGFDVDTHFTPRYDPWDQRLCAVPDGDLFKAIKAGTADVVTDHVETFTEAGIRLRSGRELPADVIVSATGLELLFLGGVELEVDGQPVDLAERVVYKGMMLEGVPNLAFSVGYTNASWTLKSDLSCELTARMLNHLRSRGLRRATPRLQGDVGTHSLLGLTAGYVQRSAHLFPKQGDRFPWQVHQSYLADVKLMRRSALEDGAMVFDDPGAPARGAQEPASATAAA